jgi:hypothetical protein
MRMFEPFFEESWLCPLEPAILDEAIISSLASVNGTSAQRLANCGLAASGALEFPPEPR